MYSYVFPKDSYMSSSKIIINGKEFNTFNLLKAKGDIIRGNVKRFIYLKNNKGKDKYYYKLKQMTGNKLPDFFYQKIFISNNTETLFTKWLKPFVESQYHNKIKSIKIYSIDFLLDKDNRPYINKSTLVLNQKFDD
ncbi:hypothetical protein I5M32_08735 [Pedobacter sp. SD-b]|uniref:Uncharacterized protein n=1 Tax=Pedobacter segetis TaxID=2793069 RepID=A0ABS1BJH2_9SPHI|nr:hypothetical protein [Pedobacter segetis]MBK0383043.1 hypothetical protein [Pedobacter segetis]